MSSSLAFASAPAPGRAVAPGFEATYDGIYLRNSLGCDGSVPSSGPYNLTPDIIQSQNPVSNPQTEFSTPGSWGQMYGTEPTYGLPNYYYVRGLQGGSQNDPALASLYYTPAQLILFPNTWKNNPLTTASGSETVNIAASQGAIAVGEAAFVLKNPAAPDMGSSFYSFISQINDSENSNPIPTITSWQDMAQILTQDLGFGFRNACYFDSSAQSWTERLAINIPSSLPEPGQVLLSISASGLTGSTIGLIVDTFLPTQQAILVQPTQIPQSSFLTGVQVVLPPGFSASAAVQWWAGSGNPPAPGASITLGAAYIVPQGEYAEAAGRALIDGRLSARLGGLVGVGPTAMAVLGSATFIASAPTGA